MCVNVKGFSGTSRINIISCFTTDTANIFRRLNNTKYMFRNTQDERNTKHASTFAQGIKVSFTCNW